MKPYGLRSLSQEKGTFKRYKKRYNIVDVENQFLKRN